MLFKSPIFSRVHDFSRFISLNRPASRMNKRCSHLKSKDKEKGCRLGERSWALSATSLKASVSFWQMALFDFLFLKGREGGGGGCLVASQHLPCERKMGFAAESQDKSTTIEPENLFPQSEPHKDEGKGQG